jgi:hypothetical protein
VVGLADQGDFYGTYPKVIGSCGMCEHYYFQHRIRPECTPIHDREGEDNYAARVEQNESAVGEGKRKVGKLQQAVEGSEAEALQKLVLYRLMHDVLIPAFVIIGRW